MPFTFLAHQAVVLPLKLRAPRYVSAVALVIGSMVPDFEKFLTGHHRDAWSHTVSGQFTFSLPLALAVYWLTTRVIAEPLGRWLPDAGPFHLRDYRAAAHRPGTPTRWGVVAVSALVGSFSHIGWDALTNGGIIRKWFPALDALVVQVGTAVSGGWDEAQVVHSIVGALVTTALLLHIGRRRLALRWGGDPAPPSLPPLSPLAAAGRWLGLVLLAAAGVGVGWALSLVHSPDARLRSRVFMALLHAPIGAFALLCALCAVWHVRQRRRQVVDPRPARLA